ncbi:hypothetical protein [Streptomyces violaceusniger]|uniref:Uncharacterized protein n=1 Tax=Streptomyces violaceusniger (strain Tu 4113) TaxID=653045 RepID=G2PHD3_STRV4|nr:hypothetical protein [Streptomyces violaceusniger]AEM88779.1 hypothetical protein Strvi_0002 [Streptomyces violaceusniger Tu 4113]
MPETVGPDVDMIKKTDDDREETGGQPEANAPRKFSWKEFLTPDFSFFLILPAAFAAADTYEFIWYPKVEIDGGGAGPNGTEVTQRIIDFQGSWWEHVLLGLPYLIMMAGMIVVSRALFRIETNMTRHSRPFTRRDGRVLRLAALGVVAADVAASVVGRIVPGMLPYTDGFSDPHLVNEGSLGGFWVFTLLLVLLQMHRIHTTARRAYEKLEEVA